MVNQDGARSVERNPFSLTSPVDGKIVSAGLVDTTSSEMPMLEQVKVRSKVSLQFLIVYTLGTWIYITAVDRVFATVWMIFWERYRHL